MNRKTFLLVLILVFFFIYVGITGCSASGSSTKEKIEIPFMQIIGIEDVFNATFNDLTDLFGPNEMIGDNDSPSMPETDLVAVKIGDDKTYMRFDLYHSAPINLEHDVFYGFAQYWTDGFDVYQYYPSSQELYLIFYDANGKYIKSLSLDLEKAKVSLIAWSLSETDPVNVATIILDKAIHWGCKPGVAKSLVVKFLSGFYIKDKGYTITDITPSIKIEFNY